MSDLLSDLYRSRSDERHLNPTYRLVPWWGLQGVNDRPLAHDLSMVRDDACIGRERAGQLGSVCATLVVTGSPADSAASSRMTSPLIQFAMCLKYGTEMSTIR